MTSGICQSLEKQMEIKMTHANFHPVQRKIRIYMELTVALTGSASSLFNKYTRRQLTGNSACRCGVVKCFELQATHTPKLHTVRLSIFELFHNAEANYSWQALPSRLPAHHHSHLEYCHIKQTKS